MPPLPRFLLLLLLPVLISGCASSAVAPPEQTRQLAPLAPYSFEQRYLTAVIPFSVPEQYQKMAGLTTKLSDLCIDELFRTKRVRIVERSRIDAIVQEITLGQSGVIEESQANNIGKQLGAEMILVGSLESVKPLHARDSIGVAWMEMKGFEVELKGRLIDIDHGEVIAVARASAVESQVLKVAMGATTGSIDPDETLINRALEKAMASLVHELAANIPKKATP